MSDDTDLQIPVSATDRQATYARLDDLTAQVRAALETEADGAFKGIDLEHVREIDEGDGEYESTLTLRAGWRLGAAVEIEWDPGDEHAEFDVRSRSKLEDLVMQGLVIVCVLGTIGLSFADVPPFDLMPDSRFLVAILSLFVGGIIAVILFALSRPLLLMGMLEKNKALAEVVDGLVMPVARAFAETPAAAEDATA